jgi:heme/copper-type cytochrome/quinol oxidase subunit 3
MHRAVKYKPDVVSNDLDLKTVASEYPDYFEGLISTRRDYIAVGLILTIIYSCIFLALQRYEYINASFNISDSVFGSLFFVITGFHGFHVLVGTLFLVVCFFRFLFYHFSSTHHVGL